MIVYNFFRKKPYDQSASLFPSGTGETSFRNLMKLCSLGSGARVIKLVSDYAWLA